MEIFIVILCVAAYIGIFGYCRSTSLAALRERRLMEDMPTSKTTGIYIGLVELKGTAESESPLVSVLAEKKCVWFRYTIEEEWERTTTETKTDSNGKTQSQTKTERGWTTVATEVRHSPFYLKDDEGVVRVLPEGAKMEGSNVFHETCHQTNPLYYGKGPRTAIADSTGRRRFVETAVPLHNEIYVLGTARLRDDIVAPEIAQDPFTPTFLIATGSEEQLCSSRKWQTWGLGLVACLMVMIPVMLLVGNYPQYQHHQPSMNTSFPLQNNVWLWNPYILGITAVFGYVLLWGIGWFWLVYNSMIGLKNRVEQATANVDVQLQRRSDLIPALVRIVSAMQSHEQSLQTALATLRTQVAVSSMNAAVADGSLTASCPILRAVVEKYPTLTADTNFAKLQSQLVETEQKIALARLFYNEMIEYYNNRREQFPDSIIARIAGFRTRSPISATDFERATVTVSFTE